MNNNIVKSSALAAAVGFAVSALLILLFSVISNNADDPDALIPAFSLCATVAGAAASGLSSALFFGERNPVTSLLSCGMYLTVLILFSLVFGGEHTFWYFILTSLGCIAASFLCGFVLFPGGKQADAARRRRARRKYR